MLTFPESDLFMAGPVAATLDENGHIIDAAGNVGVTLPATDSPGMNPTGWAYTVKESLTGVPGTRTYALLLPRDTPLGTIDLADVTSTDPTTPNYVPVPGPSAYEIAVQNGYAGTEAQWLASLKGDPGNGSVDTVNGKLGPNVTLTAADVAAMATTNGKTATSLTLDGSTGTYRPIKLQTAGVDRWQIQNDGTVESGAGAGSNFRVSARNDDGSDAGLAVYISRATKKIAFGGSSPFGDAQVTSYGGVGVRDSAADPATAASGVQFYSKAGKAFIRQGDGSIVTVGSVTTTKSAVFPSPTGAVSYVVWRAPKACTVTAVRGYRVSGTGATINASRNGTADLLTTDLSLSTSDTWLSGATLQNTALAAGDSLVLKITGVTGAPSAVTVQVDVLQGA
jgi:hypothetical protein